MTSLGHEYGRLSFGNEVQLPEVLEGAIVEPKGAVGTIFWIDETVLEVCGILRIVDEATAGRTTYC